MDAFANIYSFMEMGREQIEEYFRTIDRLAPKIVYFEAAQARSQHLTTAP